MSLTANNEAEKRVLEHVLTHASPDLMERISAEEKTIQKCWDYVTSYARKHAKGNQYCMTDEEAFGLVMHYFEDEPEPTRPPRRSKPRRTRRSQPRSEKPKPSAGKRSGLPHLPRKSARRRNVPRRKPKPSASASRRKPRRSVKPKMRNAARRNFNARSANRRSAKRKTASADLPKRNRRSTSERSNSHERIEGNQEARERDSAQLRQALVGAHERNANLQRRRADERRRVSR